MQLKIDKRFLRGGSIIQVTWDAQGHGSPELVIHTGDRESAIPVSQQGTKRLRMKGGHLLCWIGLQVNDGGRIRTTRRYLLVVGRQQETDDFEYIGQNPVRDRATQWWAGIRRWWAGYSTEKQRLMTLLGLLCLHQIVLSFSPIAASMVMMLAMLYILWIIMRR